LSAQTYFSQFSGEIFLKTISHLHKIDCGGHLSV